MPKIYAYIGRLGLAAALLLGTAGITLADTLKIGIVEDPALLDPAQSGTVGERQVFASLCDKLVDISPSGEIVPMLAESWEMSDDQLTLTLHLRDGVTFHDGTPFDAQAVKFNIERAKTMEESRRKAELASVETVEVIDGATVALKLSTPYAPLLALLSDRSGMMVSPTAAAAVTPADFANAPVCSGPYTLDRRVAQEGVYLKKFAGYWNAGAAHFDDVQILIMPDAVVRLANVQSGQIDIAERILATDLARLETDPSVKMYTTPSLSFNSVIINVGQEPRNNTPLAQNAKLREALNLAIDRKALVQAVSNGVFLPGNQLVPPTSAYYIKELPVLDADVAKARALVTEAGFDRVPVVYQITNDTAAQQIAQIIQAMVAPAGFDLQIEAQESGTAVARYFDGDFELFNGLWSGRVDPDGNMSPFVGCEGAQNFQKYCNETMDAALAAGRSTSDPAVRYEQYAIVAKQLMADNPIIPIFHQVWVYAANPKIEGFTPYVDSLIRPVGITRTP